MTRKNSKTISFSFSMPIPLIKKDAGRTVISQAGELLIDASAWIDGSLVGLPLAFEDKKSDEIKITVRSVTFNGTGIMPVLNLPDGKPLLEAIRRAALNNLHSIYNA